MKKPLIFVLLFLTFSTVCFGQYTSIDSYSGSWTDSGSWLSSMPPLNGVSGNTSIYGEINAGANLKYNSGTLTVRDTLVVYGDLILGNNADLVLGSGAVLIVLGSVSVANKVDIEAGGTFIVQGDLAFLGSSKNGSFTSDQDPAQVYVGGSVSLPSGKDPFTNYPVLECNTGDHTNSDCNYGYIEDLEGKNIEEYYQEVLCGVGIDPGSIGSNQTVCIGDNPSEIVQLTASTETTYQWFLSIDSTDSDVPNWTEISGATQLNYTPGVLSQTTSYYRQVQKGNGCVANSKAVTITITPTPSPLGIFSK
ncbi:immunoglobulin domain-containing protein [Labilibaculum antarcticum]|uniref:Ig-like domain-containing protein n=1 Tax=Labilibaculum antarcticum TaxID=1717717 RepID=A0A1Y1CL13_9BACT|nr:hypothetical protein [Labilibaculum antarcticum]BAX80682.1 hypothetical protein ALGA_2355 [Labilibaculum antarcticum]